MNVDSSSRGLRPVRVDFDEVEAAFEDLSMELGWFLDLETGAVIPVSTEVREELRAIYEKTGEEVSPDDPAFKAALAARTLPDWQREAVEDAARVDAGFGDRYIRVEPEESGAAYRDMEEYIETVTGGRLQDRLWRAIRGRGAFRRFKDALLDHPAERERWFQFRNARLRERITEWLRDEGIEPVEENMGK